VGYDAARGEPRGKPARAPVDGAARGDCIDCLACVNTCPTGIDIRDGLQMECVNCTQCIDACDAIMDRIGKPRGLIRHSAEAELAGEPRRLLRPRVAIYGVVLTGLVVALGAELAPAVRINAIAPSLTRTRIAAPLTGNAAMAEAIAKQHPIPRLGEAEDAAALADFLLSPAAGWITGQVMAVDGGRSSLRGKG